MSADNFDSFTSAFSRRAWYHANAAQDRQRERERDCFKLSPCITRCKHHCLIRRGNHGIGMKFLIPGLALVRTRDRSKQSLVTILITVAYFGCLSSIRVSGSRSDEKRGRHLGIYLNHGGAHDNTLRRIAALFRKSHHDRRYYVARKSSISSGIGAPCSRSELTVLIEARILYRSP